MRHGDRRIECRVVGLDQDPHVLPLAEALRSGILGQRKRWGGGFACAQNFRRAAWGSVNGKTEESRSDERRRIRLLRRDCSLSQLETIHRKGIFSLKSGASMLFTVIQTLNRNHASDFLSFL